jgi:cation transport regulator ChaC
VGERAYVFGYASLVAEPESLGGRSPFQGRLRGYRRHWGAAMNNWEGGEEAKHFLDRETGERPRIRVAYLDIEPSVGSAVNGVAIPVDEDRLSAFDAREINYERIDVTGAFEPTVPLAADDLHLAEAARCVYTYVSLDTARERCREGAAEENIFASRDYAAGVRLAFEQLGPEALAEYERTTDPLPFPERDLQVVLPPSATGSKPGASSRSI